MARNERMCGLLLWARSRRALSAGACCWLLASWTAAVGAQTGEAPTETAVPTEAAAPTKAAVPTEAAAPTKAATPPPPTRAGASTPPAAGPTPASPAPATAGPARDKSAGFIPQAAPSDEAQSGPATVLEAEPSVATMSLQGAEIRATVVAPAEEFAFADDNADGLIDLVELRQHRAAVEAHFAERFVTTNDTGGQPRRTYLGVHLPRASGPTGAANLKFIVRRVFESAPSQVEITYDLFTRSQSQVEAWIVGPAGKVSATLSPTERSFSYETNLRAEKSEQDPRSLASSEETFTWTTTSKGLFIALLTLVLGLAFLAFEAGLWPFNLLSRRY